MLNIEPDQERHLNPAATIHVAVGVIVDDQDRVLIAMRSQQLHQGGLWEFPGGKLEPGESVLDALHRELHEELGITIQTSACFPLRKITHHYADRSVLLDVWQVSAYEGLPSGREGQPLRWQAIDALAPAEFPAADLPILRLLQLPRRIAISGDFFSVADLERKLERLPAYQVSLVQLRRPDLADAELISVARHALQVCSRLQLALQVNTREEIIRQIPGAGLHVNSLVLKSLRGRPVARDCLFSASCHNLEELRRAEDLEADFVFLSPVRATSSHPGTVPLGWDGFNQLASAVSLPVYALGGMQSADYPAARQAGAHGIAALSAFWPELDQSSFGDTTA